MGGETTDKNPGDRRVGWTGIGMGIELRDPNGEKNLDRIIWIICSGMDLPDFCFLSFIDRGSWKKSLGHSVHDRGDELDLPLHVRWYSHRPISQPAHAFHQPYHQLAGQLGTGTFGTFGGLLPLVTRLLALPQKNILQGLILKSNQLIE